MQNLLAKFAVCRLSQIAAAVALLLVGAVTASAAEPVIRYNRDIRPILSDHCFQCHGPDKNQRQAELRLDVRDAALAAKAFVPGKSDDSELVKRIYSTDRETHMPPPEANKALTAAQQELLKQWVAGGAEYEAHWSFTPLVRPAVPNVNNQARVANPIDAFVVARLESERVAPSPLADKRTELRRLSLDLIGLPPSPAEVAEYLNDIAPTAYVKQVERLLASPHFGERWAAWWFDVARFSDTVGFHGDQNQRIFPYRDYVIDAFNNNKPFNQFTLEQLAGDLLPNPTTEQFIATGFNRLNMMTREGGAQPQEYLAKYQADRVRTVGGAWLGATLGCCECHDHKYDPFKQADFYSMSAFFADLKQWGVYNDYGYTPNPELKGWSNDHPFPPELLVPNRALRERQEQLEEQLTELGLQLFGNPDHERGSDKERVKWLRDLTSFLADHPDGWAVIKPAVPAIALTPADEAASEAKRQKPAEPAKNSNDEKAQAEPNIEAEAKSKPAPTAPPALTVDPDGFIRGGGKNGNGPIGAVAFPVPTGWVAAIRVELGPAQIPGGEPRVVKRKPFKVTAQRKTTGGKTTPLPFHFAAADRKQPRYANGEELLGVTELWNPPAEPRDQTLTSIWLLGQPVRFEQGEELLVTLTADVAPVRISITPLASPSPLQSANAEIVRAAKVAASARSPEQERLLAMTYAVSIASPPSVWKQISELVREIAVCRDGQAWTQISQAAEPMRVRLLPRGNWQDESGPVTQPATLHFLPQPPNPDGKRLTRRDLAEWLCAPNNPLTGRTVANRFWKEFFGRGLAPQTDDLGAQGEAPSHPELLDWLAVEFRENGWNVKELLRLIVMSNTYRQSSQGRPELRERDPLNRRLAAQNPRRLEAEFVRDNALAISGLINLDIGGPSVRPYQPSGYYESLQFPDRNYTAQLDERQYRRGVYMHWQRTFLHPMLANFDAPPRDECTAQRVISNTPQQALTLLNDPTFVEAARAFAERLLNNPAAPNDAARLEAAFQLALARPVRDAERDSLLAFLEKQRGEFREQRSDAQKALKVGLRAADPTLDPNELAAWTGVCRVILNLHETITRY